MDKKAEISITILVIGVFVVCTLALLSFISTSIKLRNSFEGLSLLEKASIEIEKNSLLNYYEEIKERELWGLGKEKVVFSVKYEQLS